MLLIKQLQPLFVYVRIPPSIQNKKKSITLILRTFAC